MVSGTLILTGATELVLESLAGGWGGELEGGLGFTVLDVEGLWAGQP